MREFGFDKRFSDYLEAEVLIERNGLHLRVEIKFCGALTACFVYHPLHEVTTIFFPALNREHAPDTHDIFLGIVEEACISKDTTVFTEREMDGEVIDVIFVKVMYMLFADKNGETGFENFIEFRGG